MSSAKFPDVAAGYPFPELERQILERWREGRVFERSLERTAAAAPYVFYEGPPTANNRPHVGHVVTRVVKDLFPRFRTMRGRHVARKAGWDTHGLAVEIEVEKTLGFSGKEQIEEYGIAAFNQACLDSVSVYERQWRLMSERVGYWIDLERAYVTYSNKYIESVWWALARLHEKQLLEKDYKIQPYCARCGTTLSSHEVAQNYRDVEDPSIWVLFPARPGQTLTTFEGADWQVPEGLSLVAWTTTPWTLLGHSGLAAHADLVYRIVESPASEEGLLLFAEGLDTEVVYQPGGKETRQDLRQLPPVARVRGADLAGLRYDRPFATHPADRVPEGGSFSPPPSDADGWRVFTADYVTASEGTGLVHTAPAFGEDDYRSGVEHGLPFFLTVDAEGRIEKRGGIEPFAGLWFKDADREVLRALRSDGRLLHDARYRHSYPFCWRCDQPLVYRASVSWFIRTTAAQERLIELNRTIDWHPEHIRDGRFGNWLETMVDWALSRRRYWGTPLPVWECDRCDRRQVVGSFEELFEAAERKPPEDRYDRRQFDPHRPFIDEITWPCAAGDGGEMRRVEEVIDAWFDSGAMPFAQHHYPFENRELFESQFPADFISEAVDQTRGWFYTLHVLGGLLFDSVAFKTCIVLGHVNDEQGRKMSKRLGNVVDPMEVMAETGADALRWYFCINNPEVNARFSARLVREGAQKFVLPLWNALSFFTIYANLDGWQPGTAPPEFAARPPLDRWILLRLDRLVGAVTEQLENYRVAEAARGIERFVDDLTNWYIRRSRDRFWAGVAEQEAGKESAYQALYEVLTVLARLIAPFTPFLAEVVHGHLARDRIPGAADSVHLESWPEVEHERADPALDDAMTAVQRIVRLGHAARNTHGLKTRQPLAAVTLVTADRTLERKVLPQLDLLRDELNVREVRWARARTDYVHHELVPVFPRLGPRLGKRMPALKHALAAADGDRLAAQLESADRITIEVDGEAIELTSADVEVRLIERRGTATQGDRELLVALETELTPELVAEGWAREIVHRIQAARKAADLDYADRIRVRYRADEALASAIAAHHDWIARETLALELTNAGEDEALEPAPVESMSFALAIERS
jgi:isoleucyl-tRNA synthetase